MEKLVRLPPGFRFHPTDEELVVQYLKRKAFSCPLPASVIPDIDLRNYDPWDLPGSAEGERYFFNLREVKYPKGNRANRAARSGYWKATGKDKPVLATKSNKLVGMKKVLVFHRGKPPHGPRTSWIMHEYCLAGLETIAPISSHTKNSSTHSSLGQGNDWVVCRIFMKKRAKDMDEEITEYNNHQVRNDRIELMDRDDILGPSSSSSFSSCVTDLSDEECSNGEEASSKQIASFNSP